MEKKNKGTKEKEEGKLKQEAQYLIAKHTKEPIPLLSVHLDIDVKTSIAAF